MAAFSRPKSTADYVKSLPILLGVFAILLSLPTILANLDKQQNLEQFAASRSFAMPKNAQYVPGKIIVKYQPNVELQTSSSINQHTESFGVNNITGGLPETSISSLRSVGTAKMTRIFKTARLPQEKNLLQKVASVFGLGPKPDPLANYVELDVPAGTNVQNAINLLNKDPNVASIQPDYIAHSFLTPNDEKYPKQWALPMINAPAAWDITTGSNNVIVAVIDSGIDLTHPDLQANIMNGTSFLNPGSQPQDDFGHGTFVSGIIGAVGNNSIGVAGLNWQVKLMPIQTANQAGESDDADNVQAIRYAADNGAKVINMSWGEDGISSTLQDAISYAASKGVVLIAAAGNDGDADSPQISPAAFSQVIAVSSVDEGGTLSSFSSYGSNISLAAPGGMGQYQGQDIPVGSTCWSGSSPSGDMASCAGVQYGTGEGTSFSAPQVTGVVALMLAANPNLTADQVRNILQTTADPLGGSVPNDQFGYGLVDAGKAVAAAQAQASGSPSASASASASSTPQPSTATSSASPSASVGSLPQTPLQILTSTMASSCGGQAILSQQLSSSENGGSHWVSYAANYGGQNFTPSGLVYVYVPQACNWTVSIGSVGAATTPVASSSASTCHFGFLCGLFSHSSSVSSPKPTPRATPFTNAGKKITISTFTPPPKSTPPSASSLLLPNPTKKPTIPPPPTPSARTRSLATSGTIQLAAGWNEVTSSGDCQNVQVAAGGSDTATVTVNQACSESLTVGSAPAEDFDFQAGGNQVSASGSISAVGENLSIVEKASKNVLQLILGKKL